MCFSNCLILVLSGIALPKRRILALMACTAAAPCSAASLMPGEALCGLECETLSQPPELHSPETMTEQPLWPQGVAHDAAREFLGDFSPEIVPEDPLEPKADQEPDDDAPDR